MDNENLNQVPQQPQSQAETPVVEESFITPPTEKKPSNKGLIFAAIGTLVVVSAATGFFVFSSGSSVETPPALEIQNDPPGYQGLLKKDLKLGEYTWEDGTFGFDQDDINEFEKKLSEKEEDKENPLGWEKKVEFEANAENQGQIWLVADDRVSFKNIIDRIQPRLDLRIILATYINGDTWLLSNNTVLQPTKDAEGNETSKMEKVDIESLDDYYVEAGQAFMLSVGFNTEEGDDRDDYITEIYGVSTFGLPKERVIASESSSLPMLAFDMSSLQASVLGIEDISPEQLAAKYAAYDNLHFDVTAKAKSAASEGNTDAEKRAHEVLDKLEEDIKALDTERKTRLEASGEELKALKEALEEAKSNDDKEAYRELNLELELLSHREGLFYNEFDFTYPGGEGYDYEKIMEELELAYKESQESFDELEAFLATAEKEYKEEIEANGEESDKALALMEKIDSYHDKNFELQFDQILIKSEIAYQKAYEGEYKSLTEEFDIVDEEEAVAEGEEAVPEEEAAEEGSAVIDLTLNDIKLSEESLKRTLRDKVMGDSESADESAADSVPTSEELEAQLQELEEEISQTKQSIDEMEAQLNDDATSPEKKDALKEKIMRSADQLAALEERYDDTKQLLEKVKAREAEAEEEVVAEEEIPEAEESVSEAETEESPAEEAAEIEDLENDIKALKERVKKIDEELEAAEAAFVELEANDPESAELEEIEGDIRTMQDKKAEVETELANKKQELAQMKAEAAEAEVAVEEEWVEVEALEEAPAEEEDGEVDEYPELEQDESNAEVEAEAEEMPVVFDAEEEEESAQEEVVINTSEYKFCVRDEAGWYVGALRSITDTERYSLLDCLDEVEYVYFYEGGRDFYMVYQAGDEEGKSRIEEFIDEDVIAWVKFAGAPVEVYEDPEVSVDDIPEAEEEAEAEAEEDVSPYAGEEEIEYEAINEEFAILEPVIIDLICEIGSVENFLALDVEGIREKIGEKHGLDKVEENEALMANLSELSGSEDKEVNAEFFEDLAQKFIQELIDDSSYREELAEVSISTCEEADPYVSIYPPSTLASASILIVSDDHNREMVVDENNDPVLDEYGNETYEFSDHYLESLGFIMGQQLGCAYLSVDGEEEKLDAALEEMFELVYSVGDPTGSLVEKYERKTEFMDFYREYANTGDNLDVLTNSAMEYCMDDNEAYSSGYKEGVYDFFKDMLGDFEDKSIAAATSMACTYIANDGDVEAETFEKDLYEGLAALYPSYLAEPSEAVLASFMQEIVEGYSYLILEDNTLAAEVMEVAEKRCKEESVEYSYTNESFSEFMTQDGSAEVLGRGESVN